MMRLMTSLILYSESLCSNCFSQWAAKTWSISEKILQKEKIKLICWYDILISICETDMLSVIDRNVDAWDEKKLFERDQKLEYCSNSFRW